MFPEYLNVTPETQTESFNTLVYNKWHRKVTETSRAQVISSPRFTLSQRKLLRVQQISPEELRRWCNDTSVWRNSSFQVEIKTIWEKKKKEAEWWHTLHSFSFQTVKTIWMNTELTRIQLSPLVNGTEHPYISYIAHCLRTSKLEVHTFLCLI